MLLNLLNRNRIISNYQNQVRNRKKFFNERATCCYLKFWVFSFSAHGDVSKINTYIIIKKYEYQRQRLVFEIMNEWRRSAIKWKLSSDMRAVCKKLSPRKEWLRHASISMHSYFVFLAFGRCNFFSNSFVKNYLEI